MEILIIVFVLYIGMLWMGGFDDMIERWIRIKKARSGWENHKEKD